MERCPVCGMMVNEKTAPKSEYKGKIYFFMNQTHKDLFDKNPEVILNGQQKHGDGS